MINVYFVGGLGSHQMNTIYSLSIKIRTSCNIHEINKSFEKTYLKVTLLPATYTQTGILYQTSMLINKYSTTLICTFYNIH